MRVPATLQREGADGQLECQGSGECTIYATQPKVPGESAPYVSINLGEFRIHLDSVKFRQFCEKFLYSRREDGLLKIVRKLNENC